MHQHHNNTSSWSPFDSNHENIMESFKQAAQALQNLEHRLERVQKIDSALNHIGHGMIVLNPDGVIEDLNKVAGEMLGLDPNDVIGRPVTEFLQAPELDKAVILGVEAKNMLISSPKSLFAADYTRFVPDNAAHAHAFILFQPVERLQEAEKSIRQKLSHSCFLANPPMNETLPAQKKDGGSQKKNDEFETGSTKVEGIGHTERMEAKMDGADLADVEDVINVPDMADAEEEGVAYDSQDNIDAVILAHINKIMRAEGGNISRAARRMGIDRNTLKRRLNP